MPSPTQSQVPVSGMWQLGPKPSSFTGYVVQLLMMYFSDARNIQDPALKSYVWTADDPQAQVITTKIWIGPKGRFDAAKMQMRPALIVCRKPVNVTADLAFGSEVQGITTKLGQVDVTQDPLVGHETCEYAKSGQMMIYCLQREEAAAEVLAEEVESFLLAFRKQIIRDTFLHEFLPASLEESVRLEEAAQYWAIPLTVNYHYRVRTILRPEAPLLKTMQVIHQIA